MIAPSFFEEANDFREGRALVRLNGFYGYLNQKGEFAVRPTYARASSFSEGLESTRSGALVWRLFYLPPNVT